jgi:hypothetical protein
VKPSTVFGLLFGLVTFVVTTALAATFVAVVKDSSPETILAMSAVIAPLTGLVGVLVGTFVKSRTASSSEPPPTTPSPAESSPA